MTRAQLEHIIRAAGTTADTSYLVVIESQAILGQFPDAPAELLVSNEADEFPRADPGRSDLIEGSPFQRAFGYYAHGVEETSAMLPEGWRARFVRGWCLEVHDLAIAKCAAAREGDRDFTRALVQHGMVVRQVLEQRLAATPLGMETRSLIAAQIQADFAATT